MLGRKYHAELSFSGLSKKQFSSGQQAQAVVRNRPHRRARLHKHNFEQQLRTPQLFLESRQLTNISLEKARSPFFDPRVVASLQVQIQLSDALVSGRNVLLGLTADCVEIADILRDHSAVRALAMHQTQPDRSFVHILETN